MSSTLSIILTDIFTANYINQVSPTCRNVYCEKSAALETTISVDVNAVVFPLRIGDKFRVSFAAKYTPDGDAETGLNMTDGEDFALRYYEGLYSYSLEGKIHAMQDHPAEDAAQSKQTLSVVFSEQDFRMTITSLASHFQGLVQNQTVYILMSMNLTQIPHH